jgi:pSer/pThr/pTyr-binding forkhead associated (FHA) protein
MPVAVLTVLKLCLVAVLYLFLARVVRAVWVEIRTERAAIPNAPEHGRLTSPPPLSKRAQKKLDKGAEKPRLKVVEPPAQLGITYTLDDEATIGRAPGCAVSIDDTFASQLHARVFRRDGQWFVEDLGSTNGTWINRKRVHGPMRLHPGDRLQVGNTVMELSK